MSKQRASRSVYAQVLAATVVGAALGHFFPQAGVAMKPLGDGFVRAVRMIIAPIIFCTVVIGIAGVGDVKKVGKAGAIALVYFEVVSTLALVMGFLMVNGLKPGAGMNVNAATLNGAAVAEYVGAPRTHTASDFVLSVIPSSVIDAFARSDVLQVLFFSVLFGYALNRVSAVGRPVLELVEAFSRVLFGIVGIIMRAAPLAAFGAMAATVGAFGVGTLAQLGKLIACFYVTCLLFIALVLGGIARFHGFLLWRFIRYIKDEILIAFGTSSSESVLPRLMTKLERVGVERSVVGLVIPAGYSFNLDGTAVYLSIAALFVAQATNTRLELQEQLGLLAILLITSKGSAGVAGAALVVLAGTIAASGRIPVAGVALVLGIHRFMGEAMAATNVIGNGVATLVVAHWCGQLDRARLRDQLSPQTEANRAVAAIG